MGRAVFPVLASAWPYMRTPPDPEQLQANDSAPTSAPPPSPSPALLAWLYCFFPETPFEEQADRDGHKWPSTRVWLCAISLMTCYGVNRPAGRSPGWHTGPQEEREKKSFLLFWHNVRVRMTLFVQKPPVIKRTNNFFCP